MSYNIVCTTTTTTTTHTSAAILAQVVLPTRLEVSQPRQPSSRHLDSFFCALFGAVSGQMPNSISPSLMPSSSLSWSWMVYPYRSMNIDCTAPGLQGNRINLTYRWVAQHAASCPLAGVVGCVLPTCVQGLVEPSSRWLGEGENKWSSSWGLVLLLLILVSVLLVSTWIHIRRGHRHSGQRLSCSVAHFPSRGRARWVGGRRWRLSRRRQSSKGVSFLFPFL